MATVTIDGSDYQAFQTVPGADVYLAADYSRAAGWAALSADQKGQALVSATRLMLLLPWVGDTPDPAVDQDSPIPEVASMLAADIAAKPALMADASGASNIRSVQAGSARVEFFSPSDSGLPIAQALWDLLLAADLIAGPAEGDIAFGAPYPHGTSEGVRPLYGRYPWDWPIAAQDYD
jgi:hypothetical protein